MASSRVRLRPATGLIFVLTALLVSPRTSLASFSSTSSPNPSSLTAPPAAPEERCLQDHPVVSPKRYVIFEKRTQTLILETPYDRLTQNLATHVFQTYLLEVLGYDQVQIRYYDDDYNLERIFKRLATPPASSPQNSYLPETMVNLEVWLRQDQHIMSWWPLHQINIIDAGPITSYGRLAWYIPKTKGSPRDFSNETWQLFTKWETADEFSFTSAEENALINYTKDSKGTYYCTEPFCQDGMFVPDICHERRHSNGPRCALLLASYGNATRFVQRHINELGLYVKVVWVGPNLGKVKEQLTEPRARMGKSLVFLAWSPSDFIVEEDHYHVVAFPPCEEMTSTLTEESPVECVYDLQKVVKVAWKHLQNAAPNAWEALQGIYFEHSDYRQLMNYYENFSNTGLTRENSVKRATCEWLKNNKMKWGNWSRKPDKPILYIGGIFPLNSKSYKAKGIAIAAIMAREAINKNDTLLRDYNVKVLVADGQCKSDKVMKIFIDYIYDDLYNNLVGVLGPACSDTMDSLAGVSTLYKTVVMSYSAEASTFPDRNRYPYFFRTIGENNQYNQVYLKLLQTVGWKQVASLTEGGQRYTEYLPHLQDILQTNGITFVVNRKFPKNWNATSMAASLDMLKQKNAKIIIGDVYNEAARTLMCEAYLKNMTARQGYVWFLPMWLSPEWYDTDNNRDNTTMNVRCTTAEMIEAINGHLSLTHPYFAEDDVIMQEGISVGQWKKNYKKKCAEQKNATAHDYAGFAYDAVWTYAFALDKLMRENQSHVVKIHEPETVDRYVQILRDTNFMGVSGAIKFNGGSSRVSIIRVVQWLHNESRHVGTFYPNSSSPGRPGRLDLNLTAIVWLTPDGKIPPDGTEPLKCFLSGLANALGISCEAALIVVNVIAIVFLLSVGTVVFLVYKRRYDKKMKYMESFGLTGWANSDTSDLHKWEIPRDRVVTNRKLGEGTFGTVYGGETEIAGKGWVAVAVKSLKSASTTEERLDFLAEAETMKKLDHKNIVKLIGVCLRGEPVYVVMEFMLYGDLKTYLLARRHLVNSDKGGDESDEVSSERLTSMAMDVARALSYLAENNYVHRDVASRNCLVNVSRKVKLGDFGMTRQMIDNDYYKYSKIGKFPVRWMSPESLKDGLFTPASDVWSYGVVLYEIITFGSFPFQGMANAEVLDYVIQGHTLNIPVGVKTKLEGLINSCWRYDTKRRPRASAIVDFLANNPRLLQPCLDAPFQSVEMDESNQMEIPLAGSLRKSSSTCYNRNHPRQTNPDDLLIDVREDSAGGSTLDSTVCPMEPLLGSPRNGAPAAKTITKFANHNPVDEYRSNHDPDVVSNL